MYRKNVYIPFCKLCILRHSMVLYLLVVKSFNAVNDDQLRISFIILQTSNFFFKIWLNSNLIFRHRGRGHGPSAGYATACSNLRVSASSCSEKSSEISDPAECLANPLQTRQQ